MKVVAVAKFEDSIAPCFEAARVFFIATIDESGALESEKLIEASGCEGFGRIRALREQKISTLICNGIKGFYLDLLRASDIEVIANVTLSVSEALRAFQNGKLKPEAAKCRVTDFSQEIPLEDLICWTRDLFRSKGYKVTPRSELTPFPIDLMAEITCPVCSKPVRVAICCGAHTYRTDKEIAELKRVAADYHTAVYVHPASEELRQCCEEYGVELIDPDLDPDEKRRSRKNRIPILRQIVAGHEKACSGAG